MDVRIDHAWLPCGKEHTGGRRHACALSYPRCKWLYLRAAHRALFFVLFWPRHTKHVRRDNCLDVSSSTPVGQWFTFLILFNNFVPISLYVTLEIINYIQASFIDEDIQMYDEGQVR